MTFSPFALVTTSAVTPSLTARETTRDARRGATPASDAREAMLLFEEHET